jgi:hypothetical protein
MIAGADGASQCAVRSIAVREKGAGSEERHDDDCAPQAVSGQAAKIPAEVAVFGIEATESFRVRSFGASRNDKVTA